MELTYSEESVKKRVLETVEEVVAVFNDVSQGEVFDKTTYVEGVIELSKNDWRFIDMYGRTKFYFMLLDRDIHCYSQGNDGGLIIAKRFKGRN